jgi:hypothetical protein
MKKILTTAVILTICIAAFAQRTDTVVVNLAKTSRLVFTIKDKKDLEQLKQYDFQALFNDILAKLERNDSVIVIVDSVKNTQVVENTAPESSERWAMKNYDRDEDNDGDNDNDYDNDNDVNITIHHSNRHKHRRTTQSFNLDLGINSYLEDGKFPDEAGAPYAVRPWGSWYVGLNSTQRTRISNAFFVEWSLGVSWYNFKFQNDNTIVTKEPTGLVFDEDTQDVSFIKSKLTVPYLNASLIPMFDIGGSGGSSRKGRIWRSYNSAFRIGVGPHVGYRIGGYTKQVYKEDGDRKRDYNRDNFYLSNVRYGARLQVGVRSADFFINYDMNELFATGKGPKLNAFSFGVTF